MAKEKKYAKLENSYDDEKFMRIALAEVENASEFDDVPIGAVIVREGVVIAKAFNKVEKKKNSTSHAELIAIKNAIKNTGLKYLNDCSIYVTLEPCPMCAGAIVLSRLKRLVYGAKDPKAGASGTLYSITNDPRLNHRCIVVEGVLENECSDLLKNFFKQLRKKKNNGKRRI